jgi:hypothetical protein
MSGFDDFSADSIDVALNPKAASSSTTPAPMRNNNPGALMPGGRLAQYQTPEAGLAALDSNLQNYGKQGVNTLAGVISKWAPPNENNTAAYIDHAAKVTGLDPAQPIDLSNPYVRHQLSAAIVQHENGAKAIYKAATPQAASAPAPFDDFSAAAIDGAANAHQAAVAKAQPTQGSPTGSTTENVLAGIGHGMVSTAQNVKQGFDKLADHLASSASGTTIGKAIDWAGQKLGLPSAQQASADTNQAITDRRATEGPLLDTKAGKVGSFGGQFAATLPTMLIPGANTYTGAALIGGGTGLATTEGGLADRAKGAIAGMAGGVAGKTLGDLVGAGVSKLASMRSSSLASDAAQNVQKDAAIKLASQNGYKLPPQDVNPGVVNATLEGLSGKIKTSQAASQSNQTVTNSLAKRALGLPEDAPLNGDTLQTIRQQAGNAYNAVRGTGTVTPGQPYNDAIDKIMQQANGQAKSFPGLKNDEITSVLGTLKQPTFEAGDAVDATKFLRNLADKAYRSGDKQTGAAYKQASGALEDALDSHLQSLGQPEALASFRNARQTIAKTYSVEKALNPVTGDVDAAKLALQAAKGKPLSGELRDIANINAAFPKATQTLKQNYNPSSPLDYAAAIASQAGKAAMVVPLARPLLRSAILSKPVQSLNANLATDYGGGLLSKGVYPALSGKSLRDLLQVGGAAGAIDAAK